MARQKLVSVIIPTHNGVNSISNAINSVLKQDYKNIEIIVVDDNGKNTKKQLETEQKIKKYIVNHSVRYIVHEKNKNGAAARNTGFRASKGEYISLLDDDDIYYPSKIRRSVEALEQLGDDWGLVYCSVEKYLNGKFSSVSKARKSGSILHKVLLHQVVIGSDSLMVRREVYEKLNGFDESFKRHQDFEFTTRVCAKYKVKAIPSPGVRYNITRRNNPESLEIAIGYRSHYVDKMMPYIKRYNSIYQHYIIYYNMIDFVGYLVKRGKILQAYNKFKKSISLWIKNPSFILFVIVIFVKAIYKMKSTIENLFHYFLVIKKRSKVSLSD